MAGCATLQGTYKDGASFRKAYVTASATAGQSWRCRRRRCGQIQRSPAGSVSAAEDSFFFSGLAAMDADAIAGLLIERDAAHGGFRLFLDFGLALRAAAPIGKREPGFHRTLQVIVSFRIGGVRVAEAPH